MDPARPAVAIVGAGAVAQTLGRLLAAGGSPVVAVAGRSRERAERAARFIEAGSASDAAVQVVDTSILPQLAPRIMIAVSDAAVEAVASSLASGGMRDGVALHTCGARGPDALVALQGHGVACGVLHPLQTIMTPEQGIGSLAGVAFGVAGDDAALRWAAEIVRIVGGRSLPIDPNRLSYYHAGAVMASNALMAVLDAAVLLLGQAGIDRDEALRALAPLARTSLDNMVSRGVAALTGPVVRGDTVTVTTHLRALASAEPTVARLYQASAAHLIQLAKRRGLSDAGVRALEAALSEFDVFAKGQENHGR
jgi:predicted short-subunit dehydrogenase-like oxidoreductase (DUF2520 family)